MDGSNKAELPISPSDQSGLSLVEVFNLLGKEELPLYIIFHKKDGEWFPFIETPDQIEQEYGRHGDCVIRVFLEKKDAKLYMNVADRAVKGIVAVMGTTFKQVYSNMKDFAGLALHLYEGKDLRLELSWVYAPEDDLNSVFLLDTLWIPFRMKN